MKKLFIASDHAGFDLKKALVEDAELKSLLSWEDLGPTDNTSTDYPTHAHALCEKVMADPHKKHLLEPCAVLICGSGVGMSIAANRHKGIRAVLTWDAEIAQLSREHNASNVLCLGARFANLATAKTALKAWLAAKFEGGRHERRVQLIEKSYERT